MITLEAAQTLRGKAGTASAITYTVIGDEKSTVDAFKVLAQGQLAGSTGTLYTVPGSTSALIKTIFLANTTALNVTGIVFYIGGTAAANQVVGTLAIPANGSAVYDGKWNVFDGSGNLQFTGSTGPTGTAATIAVNSTTSLVPGSAATVGNSGTVSAALLDFGIPVGSVWRSGSGVPSNALGVNGDYYVNLHASVGTGDVYLKAAGAYTLQGNIRGLQGIQGNPGVVQTVTATNGTLVAGGTAADPSLKRAAITGAVSIPDGSNAATIATDLALPGNPTTTTQTAGNNSTRIATTAYADTSSTAAVTAAIIDSIADSDTTHAPSRNAVFDALAAKAADASVVHLAGTETVSGMKTLTPGVTFGGVASPTHTAGKLVYDTDNEALTFFNNESAIAHQIGQEDWVRVRNTTGSTIPNGAAVYINGTSAGPPVLPTVALAQANAFSTTLAIGLATHAIPNNGIGYITTDGMVRDINTAAFAAGAAVYLSTSAAGGLQTSLAQSPNFRYRMGVVASSHATTGSVFVDPDPAINGFNPANVWYDVTCWSTTPSENFVGDGSTDNGPKWAAFFAALPTNAVVYFPPGIYNTSTEWQITADKHIRFVGAGMYSAQLRSTSATANLFNIEGGQYWYTTFENLRFLTNHTTTPKTAGAAIKISTVGLGANAQQAGINIKNCSFHNWFKAIYCIADPGVNGASQGPGNLSVWENLDITIDGSTGPTGARGIHINGAGVNNIISNCFINLGFPPFQVANTACIEVNASGAIQMTGMEIIGGTNCILLSADATTGANNSVAAIYATNCFLDQSAASTLKIAGPNIVNRCKFVQCGITGGNVAGATAVEIASTGSGAAGTATAKADGVDFFDCDIYPNGGSGTTNGFLLTGVQGVTINACRISGWTNGITVTPSVSNGYSSIFVTNNKLGATNNFTTPNTNGLVLNAGSFTYGAIVVSGNDFSGSTTPLVENATVSFANRELYESNVGIVNRWIAPASTATQAFGAGATGFITGTTIPIPTNGFRVGSTFRWRIPMSKTAAGTSLTFAVRYGTTNTFAGDTTNIATAAFTGTAATDAGVLTVTMTVLTVSGTSTAIAHAHMDHPTPTAGLVTTAAGTMVNMTMATFNAALTAPYLNLAISANTGTAPTILAPVTAEILR